MVVHIKVGDVELSVVQYHQDGIVVVEFTQESSVFIVVDAVYIRVEPHFASAQGAMTMALQSDTVNTLLGEQVAT